MDDKVYFVQWIDYLLEEGYRIMAHKEIMDKFQYNLVDTNRIIDSWDIFRLGLLPFESWGE